MTACEFGDRARPWSEAPSPPVTQSACPPAAEGPFPAGSFLRGVLPAVCFRAGAMAVLLITAVIVSTSMAHSTGGGPARTAPAPLQGASQAAGTPGSDGGAQTLFESVLKRYAGYKSFSAQFTESAISRATGEGPSESGLLYFLRPGLWRWEYITPEKKLVIVRGHLASVQVEGDSEPSRYDLGDDAQRSGLGLVLGGGAQAAEAFVARFEPSPDKELAILRLVPVKLSDEYDSVLLKIAHKDLTILEVIVVDPGGNSLRFHFSGFKPNITIAESRFDLPASPAPRP